MASSSCSVAFLAMSRAAEAGVLVTRANRQDKEFHFQNWVDNRLTDADLRHDPSGRNVYPDFTLIDYPEGYEVKGLAWPGREANYDSNSRVPSGEHNGRQVFYVFGRYPANVEENEYPLVDLVVCHGDFLNADHNYVHQNKSFEGFGSYGDIMVRDRKMYVAPTPFALTHGTTGQRTLIVPAAVDIDSAELEVVGTLVRTEAADIVIGYEFDLTSNELTPKLAPNPSAGKQHTFKAYRMVGTGSGTVSMRDEAAVIEELNEDLNE
jgi:hypothetical protein